jgi:hypothetical protein
VVVVVAEVESVERTGEVMVEGVVVVVVKF